VYAITPDAAPSEIEVRATDAACCEFVASLGCCVSVLHARSGAWAVMCTHLKHGQVAQLCIPGLKQAGSVC
jgi:hypothetical protein